jgi:hypothetical protein
MMLPDGTFVEPIEDSDHVRLLVGMAIRNFREAGVPGPELIRKARAAFADVLRLLHEADPGRQERLFALMDTVVDDELARFGPRDAIDFDPTPGAEGGRS